MFTKTPLDLMGDYAKAFRSIPSTEKEFSDLLAKLGRVFQSEVKNTTDMWKTYQKSLSGDASPNDIAKANKQAQELMTSAGFAMFMVIPGSFFILPFAIESAKTFGIEIVPASVKQEFKI